MSAQAVCSPAQAHGTQPLQTQAAFKKTSHLNCIFKGKEGARRKTWDVNSLHRGKILKRTARGRVTFGDLWPWDSYLTSLYLRFLIYKNTANRNCLLQRAAKNSWDNTGKVLRKLLSALLELQRCQISSPPSSSQQRHRVQMRKWWEMSDWPKGQCTKALYNVLNRTYFTLTAIIPLEVFGVNCPEAGGWMDNLLGFLPALRHDSYLRTNKFSLNPRHTVSNNTTPST